MTRPTDAQRLAERQPPASPVVMRQDWSHLLFLHWEIESTTLQATLPKGLYIDTHDDKAYLGIVPFFMRKLRPSYCPPVPGLSWFQELNLRTYIHDEKGRPGVWFYTLDCNQWLAVKIAQGLFHLPYQHAKMSSSVKGNNLRFVSQRKGCTQPQKFLYPATLSDSRTASPGSLEFFLLERYRLYSTRPNGTIYSGQVHHSPYQFQEAQVSDYSTRLFPLSGFEDPQTPPISALIAQPVSVNIHPLEKQNPS